MRAPLVPPSLTAPRCCKVWPGDSVFLCTDGRSEKEQQLLRAVWTVEPFDGAPWMKSLCNWLPLHSAHDPNNRTHIRLIISWNPVSDQDERGRFIVHLNVNYIFVKGNVHFSTFFLYNVDISGCERFPCVWVFGEIDSFWYFKSFLCCVLKAFPVMVLMNVLTVL